MSPTSDPLAAHVVENVLPRHWNTCGQAAVATVLRHRNAGPWALDARTTDEAALDAIVRRFPPDVPFSLGTSAFRMVSALRGHGVGAELAHGGLFAHRGPRVRERVMATLARGELVPVCVDDGRLGGAPFSAHWAVVFAAGEDGVRLGNCRVARLDWDAFWRAWSCPQLPWSHNACAILPL